MSRKFEALMRNYENRYKKSLSNNYPIVIRLDGKNTQSIFRNEGVLDNKAYINVMINTAKEIMALIPDKKLAYIQSDEINIVTVDYNKQNLFGTMKYDTQKIVSEVAQVAYEAFNSSIEEKLRYKFCVKTHNIPLEKVEEYFIWRQKSAINYSVQNIAKAHIDKSERKNIAIKDLIAKMGEKGYDWHANEAHVKWGYIITGDGNVDFNMPNLKLNRGYIKEQLPFVVADTKADTTAIKKEIDKPSIIIDIDEKDVEILKIS